jgi:hypothetical protein
MKSQTPSVGRTICGRLPVSSQCLQVSQVFIPKFSATACAFQP